MSGECLQFCTGSFRKYTETWKNCQQTFLIKCKQYYEIGLCLSSQQVFRIKLYNDNLVYTHRLHDDERTVWNQEWLKNSVSQEHELVRQNLILFIHFIRRETKIQFGNFLDKICAACADSWLNVFYSKSQN